MRSCLRLSALVLLIGLAGASRAGYVNFESSHVHPIDLAGSSRLLAVNTPDALLEVFTVQLDGSLVAESSIPVGLEPVTVVARTSSEAWVVNNLSDTISIVDLDDAVVTKTLAVGDEPTDVVFTMGKAFVSVSQEDAVKVYDLGNLDAAPSVVPLFGRDVRALAVSNDGTKVYAVVLRSGNETTVLGIGGTFPEEVAIGLRADQLASLGLRDTECLSHPAYPPLPAGGVRNPALTDPPDGIPKVGLIVEWDRDALPTPQWKDETGTDWSDCLEYSPADKDLFIIDAGSLAVTEVAHLGTTLFEVSVHPGGKIYVPHTEARNFVRFEHALGVQGHMVDNRFAVVDPSSGNSVTLIDLNTHINRSSDPSTNLAERQASISQPGMMVWKDANVGYLTAIGSRKLFKIDGSCLAGACIFGADRASPDVVEVGEGPTGVAFLDAAQDDDERLYVLNRIAHSIAIVQASTLAKLDEIPLHDPSSENTKNGRRFLYDGIDTSGHGDAACSSCHISGDMDGLAWDLGNPPGDFVAYTEPFDNVRVVVPNNGAPLDCMMNPFCFSHDGFDPQKGPMTTQTLRAMLEPLHWRGDRPTMNDFNGAFVGLMGKEDLTPGGDPTGLTAEDMELFRQFALEIRMPPNPFRLVDDTTRCGPRDTDPNCEVSVHGSLFDGNPTEGLILFDTKLVDAGEPCKACHAHPFGTAGGKLGGVEPTEPTSADAAALFNGDADGSPHSDLKIPHLRNMYDKFGPVWADPGDDSMPETKTLFGYAHDGGMPDLFRFLSLSVFNFPTTTQSQELRDVASFLFHFPTSTKPAVGRQVTLPEGTPPTGPLGDENLLATLIGLGDLANSNRHCELVASTVADGRLRSYHLSGGAWVTDVAGEPALTTTALRENADQPITFTCATIMSGQRLGGDRDEDSVLNGDDCAPADADTLEEPSTVSGFVLDKLPGTFLSWDDQSPTTGPSIRYDVLGGDLSSLGGPECIEGGLEAPMYTDARPDPPVDDGYYYLIRAVNPCGVGDMGPGKELFEDLVCS